MKVYFVRHGQSVNNVRGFWTGWMDVDLTEQGILDAKVAGAFLDGIKFDKVYSSDLKRAVDTAKYAIPDCEPIATELLREINVGSIAGKSLSVISDEERAHLPTIGYKNFGGESNEEFRARISEFLKSLEQKNFENVAVFAHAGVLRGAARIALDTYIPMKNMACNNCTVAILEYINGAWRLYSWINLT